MKLERVQQGIASTIHADLTADGVATNPTPDTATVTLTRATDGSTLGPYDCFDEGTGEFSHTLSPTDTVSLDVLTASWAMTFEGYTHVFETTVEIVGGFLFSLAEARALQPLDSVTKYPTEKIVEARTLAEQTIEDACERAFVPRYRQETVDGTGSKTLLLSRPDLRAIRTVTSDSTAYTTEQIAGLALRPSGVVFDSLSSWARGTANVTIGYEHGAAYPPMRIKQAALILARSWLVKGPVDDRALGQATATGDFSFGLATPGRNGSHVGIPEVDATIDAYSLHVGVA